MLQRFNKETHACYLFFRIGQEQHVVESSIDSFHLNTLFNSRHMTHRHAHTQHNTETKRREEMKETKRDRDTNEKREEG